MAAPHHHPHGGSHILIIEPHRDSWKHDFEIEAAKIRSALGPALIVLHHIGSTAIPGIYAKPIIDILAEVTSLDALDVHVNDMRALGYESMGEFGIPGRRYFRKDNDGGMRTHHVHAFAHQSPHIVRHLAFREYLLSHPETAQAYSDLKRRLVQTCDGDIDAYVEGKDAFVKAVEREALIWARGN
ncbi:MAG TPA: GrpB family protein [Candidatus Sulfotelmatobacter sp.]|nr:GrpB family protein [Candidatus Sulfotelmatobacter sp.]